MLSSQELDTILNDWNFWESPAPASVPRRILEDQVSWTPDIAIAVQGVRRCGKSTLLTQIMRRLGISPVDATFVNFEDPRLASDLNHEMLEAIVRRSRERVGLERSHYFFFDEIHHVEGWEKWLHTKLERSTGNHFAVTGSNAALLLSDFSSALTGRHRTIELFPFEFAEYSLLKPSASIEDYLIHGGFPRALTYDQPRELLQEYFTDIIERDVRRRVSIRSTAALTQLVKAVFESMGSELSQRSLAGLLGVTADTIGAYIDACAAAYLILPCPYFTFSQRKRTARYRKYYPIDLGLWAAVTTRTNLDLGKKLEAAVFLQLRRSHREICFWRGKGEVDFVIQDERGITPVQVSWDGLKKRHESANAEFKESFPQSNPPVLVSRSNAGEFLGSF
jgi:hypothetical protein